MLHGSSQSDTHPISCRLDVAKVALPGKRRMLAWVLAASCRSYSLPSQALERMIAGVAIVAVLPFQSIVVTSN